MHWKRRHCIGPSIGKPTKLVLTHIALFHASIGEQWHYGAAMNKFPILMCLNINTYAEHNRTSRDLMPLCWTFAPPHPHSKCTNVSGRGAHRVAHYCTHTHMWYIRRRGLRFRCIDPHAYDCLFTRAGNIIMLFRGLMKSNTHTHTQSAVAVILAYWSIIRTANAAGNVIAILYWLFAMKWFARLFITRIFLHTISCVVCMEIAQPFTFLY